MTGLLLDTCAVIYISGQEFIDQSAVDSLREATEKGLLYVSPITAWEIGNLASRNKLRFQGTPAQLFEDFILASGCHLCGMGPDLLIASSFLPRNIHRDPMDRIIIETARRNDLALVTRDRAILAYGKEGHVKTLSC